MKRRNLIVLLAVMTCALPACLERDGIERPGYSTHVLPAGTRVPKVADDEALAMRIMNNAGASGPLVPLRTGFAGGAEVAYWDFGVSTTSVEPVWILQRGGGEDAEPIDHPPIVDSLPGDDAYSPFRSVFTVRVTAAYNGELISSLAALEDAIDLGIIEEPVPTGTYVSWPIVPADFALERSSEKPLTPLELYGTGVRAHYLPVRDAQPFERSLSAGTAYSLRRQHELAPLDEGERGADLNEDGDQLDSNVIFEDAAMANGLWMLAEITVPSDYAFGAYRADSDLFARDEMDDPVPVPDAFIERAESEDPVYRPLHLTEAP
jgi:hypothetical protein